MTNIPTGTLFLFTEGYREDERKLALMRALQDIDAPAVAADYFLTHPEQAGNSWDFEPLQFVTMLQQRGMAEAVDVVEWNQDGTRTNVDPIICRIVQE